MNLVKFAIKGLKMTEKHQSKVTLPTFSTYNTREEGQHREISVDPENRNVRHTQKKSAETLLFIDFYFSPPIYKADSGGS